MKTNIKNILSTLIALLLVSYIWAQKSNLDIHHIGVGQGDATLFVFTYKDGSTRNILVDTGNSNSKGTQIFNYLTTVITEKENRKIDILITSHLHSDHYGGTPQLLALLKDKNWGLSFIIDRGGSFGPTDFCYDASGDHVDNDPSLVEDGEPNSTPSTSLYNRYIAGLENYFGSEEIVKQRRLNIPVKTELFSQLLKDTSGLFQFWCISSNGNVLSSFTPTKTVSYKDAAKSENDLSYSWLIQYQGFKYFSGGDIGGYKTNNYLNLETDMCGAFNTWPAEQFHFCSFKVSHHGSSHSSNDYFLSDKCGNPTLAIVPSALRSFSGTQIPTKDALNRIGSATKNQILYTFIKTSDNYYSGSVKQYNHVVLTLSEPGTNENIIMKIHQAKVDKRKLNIVSDWTTGEVTCSKPHGVKSAKE